jgi:hypothetical protein
LVSFRLWAFVGWIIARDDKWRQHPKRSKVLSQRFSSSSRFGKVYGLSKKFGKEKKKKKRFSQKGGLFPLLCSDSLRLFFF